MKDGNKLQILKSGEDGDIRVSILPEGDSVSFDDVEFCASGTQSPYTYQALLKLIEAMELDEKERPHK